MQEFGMVMMSVLGALILLCIAFGFLGCLFLLGSFSLFVVEFLVRCARTIFHKRQELISSVLPEVGNG